MSPAAKSLQRQIVASSKSSETMPVSVADSAAHQSRRVCGAMTIDVEDYFQVEAFSATIDRKDWDGLPQRVEHNTQRLLEILAEAGVQATFFTLGCIARRHPSWPGASLPKVMSWPVTGPITLQTNHVRS